MQWACRSVNQSYSKLILVMLRKHGNQMEHEMYLLSPCGSLCMYTVSSFLSSFMFFFFLRMLSQEAIACSGRPRFRVAFHSASATVHNLPTRSLPHQIFLIPTCLSFSFFLSLLGFRISLNTMTLQVVSPGVYTSQGVPISVTGIAQVGSLTIIMCTFLPSATDRLRFEGGKWDDRPTPLPKPFHERRRLRIFVFVVLRPLPGSLLGQGKQK